MQTLVLGTAATQQPLEQFFENLGDEVAVVDTNGQVRFHFTPTSAEYDQQYQEKKLRLFEKQILANLDELKQRAERHEPGVTVAELLSHLNSLPLPGA